MAPTIYPFHNVEIFFRNIFMRTQKLFALLYNFIYTVFLTSHNKFMWLIIHGTFSLGVTMRNCSHSKEKKEIIQGMFHAGCMHEWWMWPKWFIVKFYWKTSKCKNSTLNSYTSSLFITIGKSKHSEKKISFVKTPFLHEQHVQKQHNIYKQMTHTLYTIFFNFLVMRISAQWISPIFRMQQTITACQKLHEIGFDFFLNFVLVFAEEMLACNYFRWKILFCDFLLLERILIFPNSTNINQIWHMIKKKPTFFQHTKHKIVNLNSLKNNSEN